MGMTESDYMSSYEAACRQAERLAAYEDALTLPDCTVMGPEEVAALRARCEAAEKDLVFACGTQPSASDDASICDICKYSQPNGGCPRQCFMNTLAAINRWEWRGPQEGAVAHERV